MTEHDSIPVTDVDQVFPAMVDRSSSGREVATRGGDVGPVVNAALRDALGWRPRAEDPKAFVEALTASFRLTTVQGHIQSEYVARGYAVQADLGAVTGGQASLYRRAQVSRVEILRILDGLTALRVDADPDDLESYRTIIRGAVQSAVDEMGAAGGPRVQMVNAYFQGLTGASDVSFATPDHIRGYLGVFRDRAGLTNANVNTPDEEGIRTAFWTLTEMVVDLHRSWVASRSHFSLKSGDGFLGTTLIRLSRLMDAAVDQVDELEAVLDSVFISAAERRTIVLHEAHGLTLDGLLSWLRTFVTQEARRLAQVAGRDAVVSVIAPAAIGLLTAFKRSLADPLAQVDATNRAKPSELLSVMPKSDAPTTRGNETVLNYLGTFSGNFRAVIETVSGQTRVLPLGYATEFPAGMHAARTRVAIGSMYRLLHDLAKTASRVGRYPGITLLDVSIQSLSSREGVVEVSARGLNLRPTSMLAFILGTAGHANYRPLLPILGSTTADDDSVSGLFRIDAVAKVLRTMPDFPADGSVDDFIRAGVIFAAEDLPLAVVDRETGAVLHAPESKSWPDGAPLDTGSFGDLEHEGKDWPHRNEERAVDFVDLLGNERNAHGDSESTDV